MEILFSLDNDVSCNQAILFLHVYSREIKSHISQKPVLKYMHKFYLYVCAHSVTSNSFWPHELWSARLLCWWDFPNKNTEVGYHLLLQGVFLTQGSNPRPLHEKEDSLSLVPPGKPSVICNRPKLETAQMSFNWRML